MEPHKVLFEQLEWESPLPGIRYKVFRDRSTQVRLLEFTSEFVEPVRCEKGHTGIVLAGELEIDFCGMPIRYPRGSAIIIHAGEANAHKARAITPEVTLFLVEEA